MELSLEAWVEYNYPDEWSWFLDEEDEWDDLEDFLDWNCSEILDDYDAYLGKKR